MSSIAIQIVVSDNVDAITGCDLKAESDVKGLYLKLTNNGAPAAQLSPKYHHWNTVAYLGTAILKVWNLSVMMSVWWL